MRDALEAWHAAGLLPDLKDPEMAAMLLISLLTDMARIRTAMGDPMSEEEIAAYIPYATDLFLQGCGYQPKNIGHWPRCVKSGRLKLPQNNRGSFMEKESRRGLLKNSAKAAAAAAAGAALTAKSAEAQPKMEKRSPYPAPNPPPASKPMFSRAVAYGNMLFLAGVGYHKPGTIEDHTRACWTRSRRTWKMPVPRCRNA